MTTRGRSAWRSELRQLSVSGLVCGMAALGSGCGTSEGDGESAASTSQSAVGRAFTISASRVADGRSTSLRAAIDSANHASDQFSRVVIRLSSGTYQLTRCGADDENAAGDLDIVTARPVTIVGTGSTVIRQMCEGERVLESRSGGSLSLERVTITGGTLRGTASAPAAFGGGVSTQGDLALENATITGNSATAFDGFQNGGDAEVYAGGDARGGGVYVAGALTARNSTLSSNSARAGGGADGASAASRGGAAEGGGAYVLGAITLQGGTVSANQARGGDGVSRATYPSPGGPGRGGGVAQDSAGEAAVTINRTSFHGNVAQGGMAGEGESPPGSLGDGSADATGGALAAAGPLTAARVSAADNEALPGASGGCSLCVPATARGGAFATTGAATLSNSSFTNNETGQADAVGCTTQIVNTCDPGCPGYLSPYAWYTFCSGGTPPCDPQSPANCAALQYMCTHFCGWICQNTPVYSCGPARTPAEGSAIWSAGLSGESLTISRSSSTPVTAPALSFADAVAVSRLVNTTLSGNVGGIRGAQLELEHSTLTSDATDARPLLEVQTLTANRSVVVATGGPICSAGVVVQSSSYNWFSDASCSLSGPGDQQSTADFRLGALADNGGSVATRLPAAGSVLIDAIPSAACGAPRDARGVTRPQGDACDIGAVEVRD